MPPPSGQLSFGSGRSFASCDAYFLLPDARPTPETETYLEVLELNESESVHDANVDEGSVLVEELLDIAAGGLCWPNDRQGSGRKRGTGAGEARSARTTARRGAAAGRRMQTLREPSNVETTAGGHGDKTGGKRGVGVDGEGEKREGRGAGSRLLARPQFAFDAA